MNTNETNHTNTNDVKRDKIKVCSVSEAKRLESGHIIISGMIASISSLYKIISKSEWRCDNLQCGHYGGEKYNPPLSLPPLYLDNTSNTVNCFKCDSTAFYVKHTFHNARTIQLEDTDKTAAENNNAADRLEVVLYDDASCNVIAGEVVDITGDLYVQRKVENGGKGKKLVTVFYCNTITYKNKRQVIITPTDIQIIYKHRRICDLAYKKELHAAARNEPWSKKIVPMSYVDRLVAMFAPNVIGHNDAKLGILRSIVGGLANHGNDNGRLGRINTLLVGDPGTAKSLLERESTKILPNSRYVTAQNASGQSLIAIADKENDTLILRLGAVVMAKGAICAINELGAMSMEDQQYLRHCRRRSLYGR
jgi:DNA replicative helicase MCM subunit Mcm2 (Cdc46/Mcm family)